MERRAYPSDLSDAEDAVLEPHLPTPQPRGRCWRWPLRTILDGIFCILRTGAQRRQRPHEYPPWRTVYSRFRRRRQDGLRQPILAALEPTQAALTSQVSL